MRSLLSEAWISSSFALIALGLVAESVVLVGLGVLVLGTGGAARLWSRLSLERVEYAHVLRDRRAFVGERVPLRLTIANRKVLPVPWIEVRERLPEAMPLVEGRTSPSGIPGVVFLTRSVALGAGDRLEWPIELEAARRGYHRVGPARLRSGDIFGVFEREETAGGTETLIVYPRTYALPELGLPSARPFGERAGGSRIFQDPVRVVGVRDYMPGDPLKQLDWKATARAGRLQSRLYEPSHANAIVVALDVLTLEHTWEGTDPVLLERGVSIAASVARWAFERRSAIGLLTNGALPEADRAVRLGVGRRPDQLARVLEALAGTNPFAMAPLADELERPGEALPLGATLVVVAALMPPDLAATLRRLRMRGHTVHVLKTSERAWDEPLAPIRVDELAAAMAGLEAKASADVTTDGTIEAGGAR